MALRDFDNDSSAIAISDTAVCAKKDRPVVDWTKNEETHLLLASLPEKPVNKAEASFTTIKDGVLSYSYPRTADQAIKASRQLDQALQSPFVTSLVITGMPDDVVPRHFRDNNGYYFCFSDGQTTGPAHGYGPHLETITYSYGLKQNLSKIRQDLDTNFRPSQAAEQQPGQEAIKLDSKFSGALPSVLPLVQKITYLSEQKDIQRMNADPQDPWSRLNYAQAKVVDATLPLFTELGGKIDRLQPVFDSLLDNTSNLNDRTLQTQLRNTGIEISPKAKQEAQAELKQALEVIAHPESLRQETRYEQLTTQLGSGYADPYSTTNMFAYFHPSATAFNARNFMLWGDRLGGVLPNYNQSPGYITQSTAHQSGQEISNTRREITILQRLVNCLPVY